MPYLKDIKNTYSSFWSKFITIVKDYTCEPEVLAFRVFTQRIGNKTIHDIGLDKPIRLISWPSERSKVDRVHIIVNFKEQYEQKGDEMEIIESKTHVYFCKSGRSKTNEVPVESIRYDFHPNVGTNEGDPMVHLHVEGERPDSLNFDEGFKQKLVAKPKLSVKFVPRKLELIKQIRIPTIQMSLPGVLCSLVADHIRNGSARKIINKTEGTFIFLSEFYKLAPKRGNRKLWSHASARYWYNY